MSWARWTAPSASGSSSALRDDDASVGPGRAPPVCHLPSARRRHPVRASSGPGRSAPWPCRAEPAAARSWSDYDPDAGAIPLGRLRRRRRHLPRRRADAPAGHPSVARADEPGRLRLQSAATGQQLRPVCHRQPVDALSALVARRCPCRRRSPRCSTTPGVLDDAKLLDCPCNGPCTRASHELVGFDQLEQLRRTDPARYQHLVSFDYAYNIGYHHTPQHPGPLNFQHSSSVPVLADQPSHDGFAHPGRQQPEPRRPRAERPVRRRQRPMVPLPARQPLRPGHLPQQRPSTPAGSPRGRFGAGPQPRPVPRLVKRGPGPAARLPARPGKSEGRRAIAFRPSRFPDRMRIPSVRSRLIRNDASAARWGRWTPS